MFGKKLQLVLGNKEAMKEFKPIFEWLEKRGLGKLTDKYCLVATSVAVEPSKDLYVRFNNMQDAGLRAGLEYNMYCLSI